MHKLDELVYNISEVYLSESPFDYYLQLDYEHVTDYSGEHFKCKIRKMSRLHPKPILDMQDTYLDKGDERQRKKKLYDRVYYKLLNLMLEEL